MPQRIRTGAEHAYSRASGTEEIATIAVDCDRCGADHLHHVLHRTRRIDGSPWTRDIVGCCNCRHERPSILVLDAAAPSVRGYVNAA